MTVELANQRPLLGDADWLAAIASCGASLSVTVVSISASIGLPADDQTPFEREKAAFHRKLPDLMKAHAGKYVAIHSGEVATYGESENDVARRFFRDHPDADVYIGFVGEQRPAYQIRPASRR